MVASTRTRTSEIDHGGTVHDAKLPGGTGSTYADEAKTISRELGAFRAFLAEHRP